MIPRSPEDLHFLAFCLTHNLASVDQLQELLSRQARSGDITLGELLVESGAISQQQRHTILQGLQIIWEEVSDQMEHAPEVAATPGARNDAALKGESEASLIQTMIENVVESKTAKLEDVPVLPAPDAKSAESVGSTASIDVLTQGISGGSRTGTAVFSDIIKTHGSTDTGKLIGSEIAGYRIEGRLGRGGQGEVFLARQLSLNRAVALKILPPHMAENISFINRFISEARTIATFTHPNIVQVYDVGVENGVFYFTMERVQGRSLRELQAQGRIPVEVAVNLMKQALRGLERAARDGIIHRDIKPGNILIDESGELKLVDFGLAEKGNEFGVLDTKQLVGTPLYVAPEQASGKEVSSRADQYALGATFYHLITGSPPFVSSSVQELIRMHVNEPPPDACALCPELPTELGKIFQKMMAKDPADRFGSFQELFKLLEDFELREGLIEARSSFLSEGLMSIGERSVRNLWGNVALFTVIGAAFTTVAILVSTMLEKHQQYWWKAFFGNVGGTLLLLGFTAIMYIAGVRKGWLPKLGNIRNWLQLHIALALTGFFMSMVHSGNFFNFFQSYIEEDIPGAGKSYHVVPVIPFLNSFLFMVVIISGMVGRYIWRDIAKQVALDKIQKGEPRPEETHELTLAIFAQRSLRYWRIFHYPLAIALVLVTVVHIISIMYYGG